MLDWNENIERDTTVDKKGKRRVTTAKTFKWQKTVLEGCIPCKFDGFYQDSYWKRGKGL